MMMRVAFRGYADGKVLFQHTALLDSGHLEPLVSALARQHAAALIAHKLYMIEIEFLDEANRAERFFRFGTDPSGMLIPIETAL